VGDVVISNGVINLCADKRTVFAEIHRVLRPGGALRFADVANGRPLPAEARDDIALRTFCIAGGLSLADWWDQKGVRSSPVPARKPSRRPGRYCIRLSRVLISAVSWLRLRPVGI
jgi:SAM-dependent methyltransferase